MIIVKARIICSVPLSVMTSMIYRVMKLFGIQIRLLIYMASDVYITLHTSGNYQEVENILMQIQVIHTFPKVFNFVNIHKISNTSLTEKEIHFIEEMSKFVSPTILNNPRSMQQFMLKTLKVYRTTNDIDIFKTIKPLKTTQGWLAAEIDKIEIDIFS